MPHSFWKRQLCNGNRIRCSRPLLCTISLCLLFALLACGSGEEFFIPPEGEGYPSPEEGEGNSGPSNELPYFCPLGTEEKSCTCTFSEVDCTGVGLTSVPYGLGSTVQTLILKNNSLSSIDSITSQYLPSLMYIDASYNSITSVDWSSFSSLTNLEELHLQMNLIFWIDFSYFYGSKLHFLNISGNQVFALSEGSQELPFEQLYIENCGLSYFGFGASTSLCRLKILHMGGNNMPTLPDNALTCMVFLEEIKLNNLGLTTLSANFFATNTLLQFIDLSDNRLTTLPSTLFDGLVNLRELKLSGNPWVCDCNLVWLKVFMETLTASGGTVVDETTTYCSGKGSGENPQTVTGLDVYSLSGCDEVQLPNRYKRSTAVSHIALDWATKCSLWSNVQSNVKCGPSQAASCAFDFSNQGHTIVQYTSEVTGVSSMSDCRDQCWIHGFHYFVVSSGSVYCLCGNPVVQINCGDCVSATTTSPGLCGNQYSNIPNAMHMLYDLDISISPHIPHVMSPTTFTLRGGPSFYDTFLWNFGDAVTRSVLNDRSVSHTYLYPGKFTVTLQLSSSTINVPLTDLVLEIMMVSTTDQGQLTCPSSLVSTSDTVAVSATFTSASHQIVKWLRDDPPGSNSRSGENNGECESGWTAFRGRCFKVVTTAAAMSAAHTNCSNQGGQLLRYYSQAEVNELMSNAAFSGSNTQYFTGAKWEQLMQTYVWQDTVEKASVFRETLTDAVVGDCVAIGSSGLLGVDCNSSLPYVCEKYQVTCSGNHQSAHKTCYVFVSQSYTQDQANAHCISYYVNGRLATIPDAASNALVSGLVTSSKAWIGLKANTLQGHYTWVNGQEIGSYSNWVGNAGVQPCVSIDSSGQWQPESCTIGNAFVCEYFIGDEIKIPWLVTGFVPLSKDTETPVAVTEIAPPNSVISTTVTLLPASWFSTSGHVVRWHIVTEDLALSEKLALQIWRPSCSSGNLAQPGCGHSSSLFACLATPQSCMYGTCGNGQFYCLLTQACQPVSQPCTCATVTPVAGIDCQTISVDTSTAGYNLIYTTTVLVPAHTTLVKFEPPSRINIQVGDIIGFQTESQDVVRCQTLTNSDWRQVSLSASAGYWMDTNDHVNPQAYQLKMDIVCHINVVYATEEISSSPNTLGYVNKPGDYTFTLDTSSGTQTCSVNAVEEVEGLVWVYPQVNSVSNPSLSSQTLHVNIEADAQHDLTVKLMKGTDATILWIIDGGNPVTSTFTTSCPVSITTAPEACLYDSSFLSLPFSSVSHIFSSVSSPSNIYVNVTNVLNSESLNVAVHAYALITDVEFYHTDCVKHASCAVTVEVGVAQHFILNVKAGDVSAVSYFENGTEVNPSASSIYNLTRTFTKSATSYLLTANVSNPLSSVVASLTVHANTRANFKSIDFRNNLDKVAMNVSVTIEATAEVTIGAEITVTWSFGNEHYAFPQTVSTKPLVPTSFYTFKSTGNTTVAVTLEDAFSDLVTTSMVVEVYKQIESLKLSLSSESVATSQNFNLSIRVDNSSASYQAYFGPLSYSADWGDSNSLGWESLNAVHEITHQYSNVGTYTINVSVYSLFEQANIHTEDVVIEIEDQISGLKLRYDGPKHFTEQVNFTAEIRSGTNVRYSLDLGDGNSVPLQTSPTFLYQYLRANVYNAVVTAENNVSRKTNRLTLYAFDENLLQIIKITSRRCVPANETVDMSAEVAAESPNSLTYQWNFGDGNNITGNGLDSTSTIYQNVGIYTINLVVKNLSNSNLDTMDKNICVEVRVSGLSVFYANPVALVQPGSDVTVPFVASVVTGSNLTYKWAVEDVQQNNDNPVLNHTLQSAGTYTISVTVKNDLNAERMTLELVVLEVVTGLTIHCSNCSSAIYAKTQVGTALEAVLSFGTRVIYTWNFNGSSMPTIDQNHVVYNFPAAGTYDVSVMTMNDVSNQTADLSIIAQDEVMGLTVSANATTIHVHDNVLFEAVYSTGTNVQFEWICDSVSVAHANSTSLSQTFTTAGYHQCAVNATNAVSAMTSSTQVSVLDEIEDLSINHTLITHGGSSSLFAATGTTYAFSPSVNTDFKVSYSWTLMHTGIPNNTMSGSQFDYTFAAVGKYFISLRAQNAISSKEVIYTVEVQERILFVTITTNVTGPAMIFAGQTVSFVSDSIIGSHKSYSWTLNGQTYPSSNETIDITFSAAGNYSVTATISNDLGSHNATEYLSVYSPVSGVHISIKQNVSPPYLSQGASLDLSCPSVVGSDLVYNWTVVHVPTGAILSYDSTAISYAFSQPGEYHIDLKVKNGLSSGEDSLMLIVQGPITELKMTWQDSVIATGSSVTFSANANPEATDVRFTWNIAGQIRNTSTVTEIFPSVGVFKVSLTVENDVSVKRREDTVRVLDPISNLNVLNCSVSRVVGVPIIIHSSIDAGTNVSFTWLVEMNNQNLSYTMENILITFPIEGTYAIYLLAENDIDSKATNCQLDLQLPVSHVAVVLSHPDPNYIFPNQDITFTASGNNLGSAIFEWRISSLASVTSNSTIYTTSMTSAGNFTLTLIVSNGVSQVQVTLDFTVKIFMCQLPDVRRVGANGRRVQRSDTLELEVAIDPKGCTNYLAIHNWTVYQTPDCTANLNTGNKVDLSTTVTSSPAIVIKPRRLGIGQYCVHFVTGYQYTSVSQVVTYTVNVTASPLHAVIRGGSRRTLALGSEICLDGTLSYDPDASAAGGSYIQHHWQCAEGTATGGCFSALRQSRYCYQNFNPGKYIVTLEVQAPGRTSDTAQQIVEVLNTRDFVPLASVVCESCSTLGSYRVSSSQHVSLAAACENCQCTPAFSWKIYEGLNEIILDSTHTSTGVSSEYLVLSKWGALRDGFDYTFVVFVSCATVTANVGTASVLLSANLPPTGGYCAFTPTEIIPLEDRITVTCTNWYDIDDPDSLISYKIYVDTLNPHTGQNETYPLYSGMDGTQSVYLGSFIGESVVLRVMVSDVFGATALGGQSTIQFRTATLGNGVTKTDYLQAQADDVLSALVKQASPFSLLQYAIALGQQLNTESQKEYEANTAGQGMPQEQRRAAIRDAVTICLSTSVPISTLEDVQQMAFALKLLTDYSIEYLTEDSQVLMAGTLQTMVNLLGQIVSVGLDREDIPTQDLMIIINNLLSAANARMFSSSGVWASGRSVTIDSFNTNFRDLRPEITSMVSGMQFVAINLDPSHRRSVASAAMPLLEKILVYTLQTMMVTEEGITFSLEGIKIKASRSYAKDIELLYLSDTTQITFPASLLSQKKADFDEVLQVIISHDQNPYTYGYSNAALVSVPVQTLSFYETNGTYIQVANLATAERIQMYMFRASMNLTSSITSQRLSESNVYNPTALISYKTVEVLPGKTKLWKVPDVRANTKAGIGVHVQLRIQFIPNNTAISNASSVTAYLGVNFSPSSDQYSQLLTLTPELMAHGVDHKRYTFFRNDLTAYDNLYITAKNNDRSYTVVLSVGTYFSNCEFFDTVQQEWSTDGCQAQEESTAIITSCQCNHLTSFSGAGIVSITDIDFSDLADLDITTNPVVFIAVAVLLAVYILVAILCYYLDRLDLSRISRIPLCGRNGPFKYEITIVTGRYYSAGTSAHIGIKMYGSRNKGEARHLTKPGAFQRNCQDTFRVAHDASLGDITKILVWHDNTGLSPSWFLSHVIVKDLHTRSIYTFLINSWLSLEMEDGVIQKTARVSDEEELKKFHSKFGNVFHGRLADLHTWLSVSNRPDHSRFTRVQRATCCLTCVYLYMFINAMWYGIFKDKTEADAPLSWNSFGWEEIIIAIMSTIVVLPFLFSLSYIFKKSRSKPSMFQEAWRPSTAQTIEIDAVCDMSRDGGSYRTVTPLGDWVTAIDRESTTDSFAVPAGLKRTAPMHRGKRKGSSDSNAGGRERPPITSTGSKRELWNKDNIMQSWPDTMPPWIKQEKARMKSGTAGMVASFNAAATNVNVGASTSAAGAEGAHSAVPSHRSSRSAKTFFSGSKSIEDSDDDLQQQLDEADAEIARSEEKKKKRLEKMSREASGDLFDSDDEWVNEGLEDVMEAAKPAPFNPRREPELHPNYDRKHSRTSFTLRSGISRKSDSAGGQKRDSSALWRDGTRPSIVSSTTKSKSTVSDNHGRLRSLSTATSSQLPTVRNQGCTLPHWCTYVGYALCAKLCMISIILVLLYCYNFGRAVTVKWLLSLLFSVFVSILVVEPLKVLVVSIFLAWFAKDAREDNSDMIDVKPSVEANEQLKDIKFRPLGGYALLQAKEEGKKAQQLHTMLREVFVFTLMFALILAITYVNYNSNNMYYTTNNIHSKFYADLANSSSSTSKLNITNMKSIPEFWQWSESILAQSLHYRELNPTESFGYLLGPARLRQIRGEIVTCPAALDTALMSVPELTTRRCVDSGSVDPDTDPYDMRWTSGTYNWTYSTSSQLHLFSKFGQSLLYSGGGYVQHLGQSYNNTQAILQQLRTEDWIDLLTRAVFIEFTLFHPSEDLASCVTLLLEFPVSGGILASSTITTEHLLRFISGQVDPLMVCQIMFFAFVVYLTIILAANLRGQKLRFFTHLWNWIDLLICLLVWANIGLYMACVITATDQIEAFVQNQTVPAQLEEVVLLHAILRYVNAFLVFLFCLKIVRQVRFARPLYKFYTTLSTASIPLIGVFFIFTILLLIYAQFGYLLYGSLVFGYQSFQHSMTSLFGLMGSRTNFWPMFESQRVLTHLFFISFGLFVYGLVITLSVAVLTWSYKWSRSQMTYKTTLDARDYEMIDFMIKRFKLMTGMQKQKPSFRRVKFEGLPSLPSRATSSNASSRQSCSSPVSNASEAGQLDSSEQQMDYCMASLLPTWDQVLQTFQKIEDLEKQEEDVTKKLQDVVKIWQQTGRSSPRDHKMKLPNTKPIVGKPPLDPKANFARFRNRAGGRNITFLTGRTSMTPPSTFTADSPLGMRTERPYSDQGMRNDPHPEDDDCPLPRSIFVQNRRVNPAHRSGSSLLRGGSPRPELYNRCSQNSASSTRSERGLPATLDVTALATLPGPGRVSIGQKQAWGDNEKETDM